MWCMTYKDCLGWSGLSSRMPWMCILVDPCRWMKTGAGGQAFDCWCLYFGLFHAHQHYYQFSAFPSLDGMMQSSQRGKGMGQRRETGVLYTKPAWRRGRGDSSRHVVMQCFQAELGASSSGTIEASSCFPVWQLCSCEGTQSRGKLGGCWASSILHTPHFLVSEHLLCSGSCSPSKMDMCLVQSGTLSALRPPPAQTS